MSKPKKGKQYINDDIAGRPLIKGKKIKEPVR